MSNKEERILILVKTSILQEKCLNDKFKLFIQQFDVILLLTTSCMS